MYKGISGGPTQLVVINSCGAERLCSVVTLSAGGIRSFALRDLFSAIKNDPVYGTKLVPYYETPMVVSSKRGKSGDFVSPK